MILAPLVLPHPHPKLSTSEAALRHCLQISCPTKHTFRISSPYLSQRHVQTEQQTMHNQRAGAQCGNRASPWTQLRKPLTSSHVTSKLHPNPRSISTRSQFVAFQSLLYFMFWRSRLHKVWTSRAYSAPKLSLRTAVVARTTHGSLL